MSSLEAFQNKVKIVLKALTSKNQDFKIWLPEFKGKLKILRKYVVLFIQSKTFENVFLLAVVVNTIDLSLYGLLNDPDQVQSLDVINEKLTYVFLVEMGIKLLGYGIIGYVMIPMNVFDGVIVIVSLIDITITAGAANISALRAIRILRVLRILRPLHYMQKIMKVFYKNFFSFIYIILILVLLIIVYTLIGTQIYAGNLNNAKTGVRQTFNTFYYSFLSVFQLVSIENWNDIENITMESGVNVALTLFYLLTVMIFGNYVFLNLFLGVLLKGFSENEDDEADYTEEQKFLKFQKIEQEKKEKEKENEEKKLLHLDSEDWDQIYTVSSATLKKHQQLFLNVECEDSLWIFPKTSFLRISCYHLSNHYYFEVAILLLIFANSFKLGLDTFIPPNDTSDLTTISTNFDIFFNSCFIFEAVIKIISLGLFFDSGSYLRNSWNILDFFIVVTSILDMALGEINVSYLKVL